MTKLLIKKQIMEVFSWLYRDRKTGKNRDKKGIIRSGLMYLILFVFLGMIFYGMAVSMCGPLVSAGFDWLYMAMMGIVGLTFGVFGSVFNTYASLYQAKDNDFLLSMPVPVRSILIARLSGVYAMGLLYEFVVMVPAVGVYLVTAENHPAAVVFCLLLPWILSVLVLTISCILGYVVALVSSRLKNQKIITVLISLLFFGGYYYFCGNASGLLQTILEHPGAFAGHFKGAAYPFWRMGLAAEGSISSMLLFTGMVLLVFCIVYGILQHSFLRLATVNRGAGKIKYVEKKAHVSSVEQALLRKELCRFFQSTSYMLNCGLGLVMMVLAAVLLVFRHEMVQDMLQTDLAGYRDIAVLLAAATACILIATNDITAPSVSLEGKNYWILQVFPVTGWQILKAKIKLSLVLNSIPSLLFTVAAELVLKPALLPAILLPLTICSFMVLIAGFGLFCNLKAPNLNWTNEIVPIKQSMGVTLTLFGGWLFVAAAGGLCYLGRKILTPSAALALVFVVVCVLDVILLRWLSRKGSEILEHLEG